MVWTVEQEKAFTIDNRNIIVSAGAGSGKTAVLTERVIKKIQSGVDISKLLILTFGNLAALEMKKRIRKALLSDVKYKSQAEKLDSCFITTIDSFCLSIVKKYHYVLNIDSDLQISSDASIDCERKKIVEEVIDEYYSSSTEESAIFKEMVTNLYISDDRKFRKAIYQMSKDLDKIVDCESYLNRQISCDSTDFTSLKDKYIDCINDHIKDMITIVNAINNVCDKSSDKYQVVDNAIIKLKEYILDEKRNVNDYLLIGLEFPKKNKNCHPEYSSYNKKKKELNDKIKEMINSLNNCILENDYNTLKTYRRIVAIILNEINNRINKYKGKYNINTFTDIAKKAVRILKTSDDAREELKSSFNEIMIDEYQDTSDIQEELVNLFANNNVYVVGDVKQSIYLFRDANPNLFMSKYRTYKDYQKVESEEGPVRIDLNRNFRSRSTVISSVNQVFEEMMTEGFGGADYKCSHKMIYGLHDYDSMGNSVDYKTEVLDVQCLKELRKEEREAFAIGYDIKKKINEGFLVYDKSIENSKEKMRKVKYKDFAIIMSKTTSFDTYLKIFEYLHIPLSSSKKISLNDSYTLRLVNNAIKLVKKINEKCFDNEFKHQFLSLSRSYLFKTLDEELYDLLEENSEISYRKKELFNVCTDLIPLLEDHSFVEVIDRIVKAFGFIEKSNKTGNLINLVNDINAIYVIASEINKVKTDVIELTKDFDLLLKNSRIEYEIENVQDDSVSLITIHKSKGLEYPICYLPNLFSRFEFRENKEEFILSKDLGIITPSYNEGKKSNFVKEIFTYYLKRDQISEEVRKLYVAMTRAREKLVFVSDLSGIIEDKISYSDCLKYDQMLKGFFERFDVRLLSSSEVNETRNYLKPVSVKKLEEEKDAIKISPIKIESSIINKTRYSKELNVDIDNLYKYALLDSGSERHEILELVDFNNIDNLPLSNEDKLIIKNLLTKEPFNDYQKAKAYKEYSFVDGEKQGSIDLLLEFEDEYRVIDYKQNNIYDLNYDIQVKGYMDYIKKITSKKVTGYLISNQGKYRKIDE